MIRTLLITCVVLSLVAVAGASHGAKTFDNTVVVYYFHRTVRCHSCTLLEEITRETVRLCFEKEAAKGRVELRIVNMDDPDKSHFIKDFNLPYQSIVLEQRKKGNVVTWKRLDKVWDLLNEQHRMMIYIEAEIKKMLESRESKET